MLNPKPVPWSLVEYAPRTLYPVAARKLSFTDRRSSEFCLTYERNMSGLYVTVLGIIFQG